MKKFCVLICLAAAMAAAVYASGNTQPGAGSAAGEKPVLTGFAYVNARLLSAVSNFNEVWAIQEAERATGIHVDWIHPPAGQHTEQANLIIASGDLPDFMYLPYNSIGGLSKLLADNTIIKLNPYLDAGKMPGFKAILDKYPSVRRQLLMDDGTLAGFFMLRIREHEGQLGWFTNGGLVIRKDWLDALNLETPVTVAQFEDLLRAFKTRDLNGNGLPDELPLVNNNGAWGAFAQYWGLSNDFYDLNGVVKFGPIEARYRDYVETLARWHKDGLIDPDWTTTDEKMMQARFLENRAGAVMLNVGSSATLLEIMRDTIPGVNFIGVRNFQNAADGKVYSTLLDLRQSFVNEASMITSGCDNIDAALKYLDWAYTPTGFEVLNWGQPGVSYVYRDGKKYYTDEILNNPKGYPMDRALAMYTTAQTMWSLPKDPEYWVQATLRYPYQIEAIDNWGRVDYAIALPPISETPEEVRRLAQIMSDINTLRDETVTRIILGTEPISALDAMVSRMKTMGIDEAIKIRQAALDRFNARK